MRQHLAFLTLLGALSLVAATQAQSKPTLVVGSDAPKLEAKFVKGDDVKEFKKGSVYVVEFWATWCGPCKTSIPHLTELAKKYKDQATFVGVSVYEEDQAKVEPFVKEMGDQMAYNVAMDLQESATAREGKMSKGWMDAAGQEGIPTAFIVDQDSKVAWIGHPMNIEEPLDKVVKKTWDRDAYAKSEAEAAAKKEDELKKDPIYVAISTFKSQMEAKDYTAALKTAVSIETMAPSEQFPAPKQIGLSMNLAANRSKMDMVGWYKTAGRYAEAFKDDASTLNQIAWEIADPKSKLSVRKGAFAVKTAKKAAELTNYKEAAVLDTLAWAYYLNGQKKLAISTEKKALKLELDAASRKELTKNLQLLSK